MRLNRQITYLEPFSEAVQDQVVPLKIGNPQNTEGKIPKVAILLEALSVYPSQKHKNSSMQPVKSG